jgi:putative hydrolase
LKYILDAHTHTISSGHAYSTITENARYAADIGLKLICMTDHAPKMPGSTGKLHFVNSHVIPDEIYGVEILKGVELNIMNHSGEVDIDDSILQRLEVVIASLHPPCIHTDKDGDFTDAIINTMKNKYVNIIGHPGDVRYPFDVKRVVEASKYYNVALEVNNTSFSPKNSRSGGDEIVAEMLLECKKTGTSIVLGSDAHYHTYIGGFEDCEKILKSVDFPDELVLNTDVEKFKKFLETRKNRQF